MTTRVRPGSDAGSAAEPQSSVVPVVPENPVPRPPSALDRTYRLLTLGVVSTVLLVAFEAMAVSTAMPVAARALHGLGMYAFAFSGYFTTSLLAMVVSGEWCDRSGPLAPIAVGIGLFGAGLLVAGLAADMPMFVAGRGIQGLGGGLVIVALYVVVARAYPEELHARMMSAFSAAWVLPSVVGPLVSGAVTQHLGWRWVFLSIPVLVLLPALVMLPQLRRLQLRLAEEAAEAAGAAGAGGSGEAAGKRGLDRRRLAFAVGLSVGAGLLEYAGDRLDWIAVVPAVAGLALLAPSAARLLPAGTFRARRGLPSVVLLRGIGAGSFFAAESFIPLMLVSQRGLSPTLAGLTLTGGALSWSLGSYLQGRPGAAQHRVLLVRLGFLGTAVAIATATTALVQALPAWLTACGWVVGGTGMGFMISSLGVLMFNLSAPEDAGANSASLQVSDSLGNVLMTLLAGVLFAALSQGGGGFAAIFVTMAVVAFGGSLLCGRLRPASR